MVVIGSRRSPCLALEEASEQLKSITICERMSTPVASGSLSMMAAFDLAKFEFLFQGLPQLKGEELVDRFYDGVVIWTAGLYG
tara:strand:- start:3235 stop:3483 length:249 start_codon:yes stop_codon:yes gene_type:complete